MISKWFKHYSLRRKIRRRLVTALFSIFLATLVFLTVTTGEGNTRGITNGSRSSTYSHTLKNIPISFEYDSKKYYISGYASNVSVQLSSSNRINLTTELDASTRNIQVVADLSNVAEGTSNVELDVHNLPSGMTAKVIPRTVSVTIGKRKTKNFNVQADIETKQLQKGYSLGSATVSLDKVAVTSNEDTITRIDHIRASLPDDISPLTKDYQGEVNLEAVDKKGNVLPATIEKQTAKLKVNVTSSTKKVPVKIKFIGQMDPSVASIDYSLGTSKVTLRGKKKDLDKIKSVTATIDIAQITKNTTKTVSLSSGDNLVTPGSVKVTFKVKKH